MASFKAFTLSLASFMATVIAAPNVDPRLISIGPSGSSITPTTTFPSSTGTYTIPSPTSSAQSLCGTQAYDPTLYTCYTGVIDGPLLCPSGLLPCGIACYDSNKYYCDFADLNAGPVLVGANDAYCGCQAYNTANYYCLFYGANCTGILCPKTAPRRCGQACYNDAQYGCVNGNLVQGASNDNSPISSTPLPSVAIICPVTMNCATATTTGSVSSTTAVFTTTMSPTTTTTGTGAVINFISIGP